MATQRAGLWTCRSLARTFFGLSRLIHLSCASLLTFSSSFHAIYLPAILQALELPLQTRLLAHAHWTVEQKKMSKSVGNVADPFEAMAEFGVDVVRFYLARVGGRFRDDTGKLLSTF